MRQPAALAVALIAGLTFATAAHGGSRMVVGTAEDAPLAHDHKHSRAELDLAQAAGFGAVRLTAYWRPGQTEPEDSRALANAVAAADDAGIRVLLQVRSWGGRTTPVTAHDRAQFAAYAAHLVRRFPSIRDVIVGNEPNANRFWLPQFGARGESVAPRAYLALLAASYDGIKAVDPRVNVIGGALASRGADNPSGRRQTHSPTLFIRELGRAYRLSGRRKPVMDAFAHHPYGDHSSQPPEFRHSPRSTTIGLADYGKLTLLLDRAFAGTAQPARTLPIVYDEYGIDSAVPPAQRSLYSGQEIPVTRPVPEPVQGLYYRRALALAACQPRVRAFLIFHVRDEIDLAGWQSGVYYPDGGAKASQPILADAIRDVREDALGKCKRTRQGLEARRLGGPDET